MISANFVSSDTGDNILNLNLSDWTKHEGKNEYAHACGYTDKVYSWWRTLCHVLRRLDFLSVWISHSSKFTSLFLLSYSDLFQSRHSSTTHIIRSSWFLQLLLFSLSSIQFKWYKKIKENEQRNEASWSISRCTRCTRCNCDKIAEYKLLIFCSIVRKWVLPTKTKLVVEINYMTITYNNYYI